MNSGAHYKGTNPRAVRVKPSRGKVTPEASVCQQHIPGEGKSPEQAAGTVGALNATTVHAETQIQNLHSCVCIGAPRRVLPRASVSSRYVGEPREPQALGASQPWICFPVFRKIQTLSEDV